MTARSPQLHRGGESILLPVATSFSASVIGGGFEGGGTQRLKHSWLVLPHNQLAKKDIEGQIYQDRRSTGKRNTSGAPKKMERSIITHLVNNIKSQVISYVR
jgi:hypothetical protein